jgi:hypothetical protein
MSTQYRLVQSGKTASGAFSAGQGSPEPVAPRILFIFQNECGSFKKRGSYGSNGTRHISKYLLVSEQCKLCDKNTSIHCSLKPKNAFFPCSRFFQLNLCCFVWP